MKNFLRNLPNLPDLKKVLQNYLRQTPNHIQSHSNSNNSKHIQFEKAKTKLIVSQTKSNLNIKSELLEEEKLLKLEKEQQKSVDAEKKLQLAQLAEQCNQYNA